MNDNNTNIIDLSLLEAPPLEAVVVPAGLRDTIVMGFTQDGGFLFLSDGDDLGQLALLVSLAQRRIATLYDEMTDDGEDDEPPQPRAA